MPCPCLVAPQKLGLSASNLRKAFTSLTSSLTSLRTDAGGAGVPLTLRTDIAQKVSGLATVAIRAHSPPCSKVFLPLQAGQVGRHASEIVAPAT